MKQSTKLKSVRFPTDAHEIIESLRKEPKHTRNFSNMVIYLIENSPEYSAQKKKLKK